MVNKTSEKFSPDEMLLRSCHRIAFCMHSMWEETGRSDTRLLMEPLISNGLVIAGRSRKGADRKEHVVPRSFICQESHRLFQEGATISQVADFIARHLQIVLISFEEQRLLDNHLRLKETMPTGWTIGDDIYARLKAANIEFEPTGS